jgi:hypothetical protein
MGQFVALYLAGTKRAITVLSLPKVGTLHVGIKFTHNP